MTGETDQPGGGNPPRPRRPRPTNPTTTAKEPRTGYTAVGRVLRPHALRGELRVAAFSATARNLQRGRPIYLGEVRRVVERARPDQDQWIIKLSGLDDRTDVETFRGELLEAADNDVMRDDEESYFVHELIGLRVVTEDGRELGRVTEVLQTGANDVYVAAGERGEVLVPAIAEVVQRIDLSAGTIAITPLPGMLDESR